MEVVAGFFWEGEFAVLDDRKFWIVLGSFFNLGFSVGSPAGVGVVDDVIPDDTEVIEFVPGVVIVGDHFGVFGKEEFEPFDHTVFCGEILGAEFEAFFADDSFTEFLGVNLEEGVESDEVG